MAVHRFLCALCVILTGYGSHFVALRVKINCQYAPPKNPKKLDIPEGVPSGLWDVLVSIKADTAANSLRVDHLVSQG